MTFVGTASFSNDSSWIFLSFVVVVFSLFSLLVCLCCLQGALFGALTGGSPVKIDIHLTPTTQPYDINAPLHVK